MDKVKSSFGDIRATIAKSVIAMEDAHADGAMLMRKERSGELSFCMGVFLVFCKERHATGERREEVRMHLLGLDFAIRPGLDGTRYAIEAADFRALRLRYGK